MPTNLEQARAEVENLFASNPSLVLDPSVLQGKLTLIATNYGLVATSSFDVGLSFELQ